MTYRRWSVLAALAITAVVPAGSVCAQEDLLELAIGDGSRRDKDVTVHLDAVVDTRSGAMIAPAELFMTLGSPRAVLVGEEHTDAAHHDVQLHVLKALRDAAVPLIIGLEMFPASSQAVLDRWVNGTLDEAAFINEADWYSVWGYHWGYYREIFEFARVHHIRLVGLDETRDASASDAALEVSDELTDDHRALVRAFFEVDSPVHGGMTEEQLERLTSAQARRDAVMAQHVAMALERNPLHTMVVLAGTGHVLYDLGIARQLPPTYRTAAGSVMPVTIEDESRTVRASVADVVWGIPESPYPRYPDLGVVAIGADHGLDVIHVEADSPANTAGIQVGDRLTGLNGAPLWQRSDLSRAMGEVSWSDIVTVTLERDDASVTVDVALRR